MHKDSNSVANQPVAVCSSSRFSTKLHSMYYIGLTPLRLYEASIHSSLSLAISLDLLYLGS